MLLALLWLAACAPTEPEPAAADPAEAGPWRAGHRRVDLARGGRGFAVELWYPTEAEAAGEPVPDAFLDGERRETYAGLLAAAPEACPSTRTEAARDAVVAAGGPWPVVISSHCFGCTRFSTFTVAERLATHGFVVAAPDHEGDTLFDTLAGAPLPLDTTTLALRRADMGDVLDRLLDGSLAPDLAVDPARVGAMGHSFGSVTTGLLTQEDPRVRAAVGLAAPMENPLLPGVRMADLTAPLMLLVAREDHSISELGNLLIRDNAANAGGPVALVEVDDAGHWSVSDLCGVDPGFMPGCGADTRLDGSPFDYLPAAEGRATTATLVTSFLLETLVDGVDHLGAADIDGVELSRIP